MLTGLACLGIGLPTLDGVWIIARPHRSRGCEAIAGGALPSVRHRGTDEVVQRCPLDERERSVAVDNLHLNGDKLVSHAAPVAVSLRTVHDEPVVTA